MAPRNRGNLIDDESLVRIRRSVDFTEAYQRPPAGGVPRIVGQAESLAVLNISGETVPPFGAMRIVRSVRVGEQLYCEIEKPNAFGARWRDVVINGEGEIPDGEFGQALLGGTALGAFAREDDGGTEVTPEFGQVYGPRSDSWLLHPNTGGFRVLGGVDDERGLVQVMPEPIAKLRAILLQDLVSGSQATAAVTVPVVSDEVQVVQLWGTVSPGSTFTVGWPDETSDPISVFATADEFKAAMLAMPSIEEEDVTVTGQPGRWTIVFRGQYAGVDVPLLTVDSSLVDGPDEDGPLLVARGDVWEDCGETETVHSVIPTHSPTPLIAGIVVICDWFPGVGWGVTAAEYRDFSSTLYGAL